MEPNTRLDPTGNRPIHFYQRCLPGGSAISLAGICKMTRRIIISILLTFGILTTALGQTKDDRLKDIRDKFRAINSDTGYVTKTLTNEQFLEHVTDAGGELTGHFKNGQIKKIIERIGLSYCVRTFEYYFWDGYLIFVYEKEDDFPYIDTTGTLDHTKLELAFEGRYYFDGGKVIETKITGQKRIADNKETDIEKELGTRAKQNVDSLKKSGKIR